MPSDTVRDVTIQPVAGPDGQGSDGHALAMTIDLTGLSSTPGMLEEAISRFKRECIAGPADLRYMLITAVGDVAASELADAWRAGTSDDAAARVLLGAMHQADVMQCDTEGRVIGQASLLFAPPAPPEA